MSREKYQRPTESELEILSVLWDRKQATVREVHEEISKKKESGYTTTLKLMQIMHDKNLVSRNETHKTHVYKPAVSREKTQMQFLSRMIDNLFSGSSASLVMQALGRQHPDRDELEKIQELLNKLKEK